MELKDKYEEEILDSEELINVDGDLNPYKYVDITIQRALRCLSKDDLEAMFFQYTFLINNLEGQCKSLNKLSKAYFDDIKTYTDSKEHKEEEKNKIKQMKFANKKFELIMRELNEGKKLESPLVIRDETK